MHEGWHNDQHLILFEGDEVTNASNRYDIDRWLAGFTVIGLLGWDDFIVRDRAGGIFTVPTLPTIPEYLEAFELPPEPIALQPDTDHQGRVKWYIKPVALGGDPGLGENLTWVAHNDHAPLVRWWNAKYREVTATNP